MEKAIEDWLYDPLVGRIVAVLVVLTILVVVLNLLKRTLSRRISDSNTRYRVKKILTFASYLAGLILIATIFSDKLGGLTVAFGVAGAGIAFALQEVIASVAGWLAVSLGGFYKIGDRLQLGGIKGDVIDISILRTTLMELGQWVNGDQYNGRVVRIANSFVFKEPVFNYSGDFPFLWDEITMPVKYGSDLRLARSILSQIAVDELQTFADSARQSWTELVKNYMIEDASVDPAVTIAANDNWVEFSLRYVVDYKRRRTTKDLLYSRILESFDSTNGRVAVASATVQIVEVPLVKVRVEDKP